MELKNYGTEPLAFNIEEEPMKLYSIYSPANHPFDTEEDTKEEALKKET